MSGDIIAQTYRIINELSEFTQCSIFSNCFTFFVFDRSSTNVGFLPAWKDNSDVIRGVEHGGSGSRRGEHRQVVRPVAEGERLLYTDAEQAAQLKWAS